MKDLIIVGAGSAAREYLQFAKDINNAATTPRWHIKGFIADSGVDIKALTHGEYNILGTIRDWKPSSNEEYVCSVSEPCGKKKVVEILLAKGAKFTNFIHPLAVVPDYVDMGQGVVMYPRTYLGPNVKIGNFVTLDADISHDDNLQDYVTISGRAHLSGYVDVGKGAFIGSYSVIAPNIKIGDWAFVCIGSVVIRNVRSNSKVIGNPAKRVEI